MKAHPKLNLLMFLTVILIFAGPLAIPTAAHDPPTRHVDGQQRQYLGDLEIIIPGQTRDTDTEDDIDSIEKQAVADAKRDAKAHLNKTLWFTTGCFFPLIGAVFSQRTQRSIPIARTLGKPPQYVAFYTDTYKIEMKKLRFNWALGGCIVGGLVDGCLMSILINRYTD